MITLEKLISDTTSKFGHYVNCDMPVPDYIRKQVDAIFEMETDFIRGLANFTDGLLAERDYLDEVLHGQTHILPRT